MKRIISLIALTLVFGCGEKQSPESKKDIAIFTSQDVKAYILVLSPDLDLEKMVSTFPPLFDKWESIKQTHTLPHKEAQRVSDALNLHKLFLLYYEVSITDHCTRLFTQAPCPGG